MSDLGDDDATPPRGRRHQSQTERDLTGIEARRARDARARDQLAELEQAAGAPEQCGEVDDTKPVHLLTTAGEIALYERYSKLRDEIRRGHKDTGDRILEAMGSRPPAERLAQLEARVKMLVAILAALGTLALGSIITTAKLLYEHGEAAGEIQQRAHALEQRADRDEERIDRLERDLATFRRVPFQDRAAATPTRTP